MSIAHIPKELRDVGLMTSHVRPLVSEGKQHKQLSAEFSSRRVDPELAWYFPEIELRTPVSETVLLLDLDYRDAATHVDYLVHEFNLPIPNWVASREGRQISEDGTDSRIGNGHAHAAWVLAQPVYTSKNARREPQRYLRHIRNWYTAEFSADPAYGGVLTHNPTHGNYITRWLSTKPYTLAELADPIPEGWQPPKLSAKAAVGEGRNRAVFDSLMSWAGSPKHEDATFDQLVDAALHMAKQVRIEIPKVEPFDDNEVLGIVRNVDDYRENWTRYTEEERKEWARRNQAKGVANRRKRNAPRDARIVQLRKQGWTQAKIANEVGLSQQAIGKILRKSKDTLSSANSPSIGRVTGVVK